MKKKLLIGLTTFYMLILALLAAVVIYFWSYISAVDFSIVNFSNVKALYQGLTEDPEVTSEKKKVLDSERSEKIREYVSMELRDFTDEEKKQIESGEKSETQILAQIIFESVEKEKDNSDKVEENEEQVPDDKVKDDDKPDENKVVESDDIVQKPSSDTTTKTETEKTPGKTQDTKKPEKTEDTKKPEKTEDKTNKETADQIVARHVSALYSIQSNFEGRVAALASSASNWVKAYKKANPGITWKQAKVAGVKHFSGTASSLESECYAKVDAQIELLRAELKAIGADTSIVNTIKQSAYSEMDAKKAQIVQQGNAKLSKNN